MIKALFSLCLALCLTPTFANIIFNHVRLTCDNSNEHSPGYTGCLRGQTCIDEICVFHPHSTALSSHEEQTHGKRAPTAAQAGGEPTAVSEPTTGPNTVDGSCGASRGNTVCGDWPLGSCCSMYGYCGNDSAHCDSGCQSGPCLGGNPILGPGPSPAPPDSNPGSFKIVGRSGVPAQHAGLLPNGRVVFLDRLEINTELKLANGQFAYSAEYDPTTNTVVPLEYQSNAFCSGGTFLPNGDFISIGGNDGIPSLDPTIASGLRAVRYLSRSHTSPALNGQAWTENNTALSSNRWYASAQILPDGTVFVASGSLNGLDPTVFANNNPTFEILNTNGVSITESIPLQILVNNQPYYMYPYIHLLNNGDLFIFVARASQRFSASTNTVTATFPEIPGDFRTYPNGGGSVLLPLSSANGWAPEIMICGGGVVQDINSPTDPSCGRILPLSPNPSWSMDSMPTGRAMPEGVLLPDGTVLWLNGAKSGAEGFGLAADPAYQILIYDPTAPLGARWTTGASSTIARLYHSVALLLLDGTVMVAGSNPVSPITTAPVANQVPSEDYVTEFRVEVYTPGYLSGANAGRRPGDVVLSSTSLEVGGEFTVTFTTLPTAQTLRIALYHGGFVTHGLHMNQRMLFLDHSGFRTGKTSHSITVTMPPTHNVAPPGPYVVYMVVDGVPAVGQFVSVQ